MFSRFVMGLLREYEALLYTVQIEKRLLTPKENVRVQDIKRWVGNAAGTPGRRALDTIFNRVICLKYTQ